jgi:hypothetical protein
MLILSIIIFFVVPIAMLVVGGILWKHEEEASWLTCSLLVIGCCLLIITSICFVVNNVIVESQIINYKVSKNQISEYERGKLLQGINANKEWNKTIFDVFIPDDVNSIE